MTERAKIFRVKIGSGAVVQVEGVSVIPRVRTVSVRWPGGGRVWNRPVALEVSHGGNTRRIPIVDVTRLVQVGTYVITLLLATTMTIRRTQRRTRRRVHCE